METKCKQHLVFLILPFLFFHLFGCSLSQSTASPPKGFPDSLKKMLIHNSPKVIYSYFYGGAYAFSDFMYGCVPLDSTKVFSWENSRQSLPAYITNIDAENNLIECIKFIPTTKKGNSTTHKEYIEEEINGMEVKSKQYYLHSSSLLQSYFFHNLTETHDSIFFDSLTVNLIGTKVNGRIGFKKYNITVQEDSCGYIQKIELPILSIVEPLKIKEYDLTSLTNLPPLSTVYKLPVEMRPDSLSQKQRISGYGVYKKVDFKTHP